MIKGDFPLYAGAARHKNLVINCMRVVVSLVSRFNIIVLYFTFLIILSHVSREAVLAFPLLFKFFSVVVWSHNHRSNEFFQFSYQWAAWVHVVVLILSYHPSPHENLRSRHFTLISNTSNLISLFLPYIQPARRGCRQIHYTHFEWLPNLWRGIPALVQCTQAFPVFEKCVKRVLIDHQAQWCLGR